MSLGISVGICLRRCGYAARNVLVRHHTDVPLRGLGDAPSRCCWVFHLKLVWDVAETYQWYVVVTYSTDVVTTFINDVVEAYHWEVLGTFHRDAVGCFIWDVPETSLGRTGKQRRHDVLLPSEVKVRYFSVFSPKQVNCFLNSSANSFMIKW